MLHIIERFFIHFFCATAIVLIIYYILRFWTWHNKKVHTFLSDRTTHLLVVSALITFGLITQREAYDIILGNQIWYKTIFDQISWLLGASVGAWGLYRFRR